MYEELDRQHTYVMYALTVAGKYYHKVRKERLQQRVQQFGDNLQQVLTDAGIDVVSKGEGYLLLSLPAIGNVMLAYGGRNGYRLDGGDRLWSHPNSTIRKVAHNSYSDTQSLVWLLQELREWAKGFNQCSTCWYSNWGAEYCGMGMVMNTATCSHYRDNHNQ